MEAKDYRVGKVGAISERLRSWDLICHLIGLLGSKEDPPSWSHHIHCTS